MIDTVTNRYFKNTSLALPNQTLRQEILKMDDDFFSLLTAEK